MSRQWKLLGRARQRGMAAILVVLLTGTALTVTTLGVAYTVRGTQSQQLASHASTGAESLAWAGVETLRQGLSQMTTEQLEALRQGMAITIAGTEIRGVILQNVAAPTPATDPYKIFADITGTTDLASHTLRVTYEVTPPASASQSSDSCQFEGPINIYDDLSLSGGLTFLGGTNVVMNVEGNVNVTGGIRGINTLRATGDITLTGGTEQVQTVVSNGNITLTGGASAAIASAIGNITIGSGNEQGVLSANGDITLSNGSTQTANSLGNITVTSGGTQGTLTAAGNVIISNGTVNLANAVGTVTVDRATNLVRTVNTESTVTGSRDITQINANGNVITGSSNNGTVNARGDVTVNDWGSKTVRSQGSVTVNSGNLTSILAQGNLNFFGWGSATGTVGGSVIKSQPGNSSVNVTSQPGLQVPIDPVVVQTMSPIRPFTLTRPVFDARLLESSANYVFKARSGDPYITVRNINSVPDGEYYLGKMRVDYNNQWGYLCSALDNQGFCATECSVVSNGSCAGPGAADVKFFCRGQSLNNQCFTYHSNSRTWTFNSTSGSDLQAMAPGILWFEGNLETGNGTFRNTMIATENINNASGSVKIYATNYAGYQYNCNNSQFPGLYPTNLCQNGRLISYPIGNVASMAGSYDGDTYVGGELRVGSSTEIFGDVVAGNQIRGGGGATIHGFVSAAGLSEDTSNSMTGGLVIDLRNPPEGFSAGTVPGEWCPATRSTEANTVQTRWVRSL